MTRPAVAADFAFIYGLYFHPQVNPFLLYEMMGEADFQPVFEELLAKKHLFIFEWEGERVGMFKLVRMGWRTDHVAYLGGVAIRPDLAGQGLGEKMLLEILDIAREMSLRRVELSTATFNERAIRLYEKMGFEREGVLRSFCHLKSENRVIDEVLMSILF